MRAPQAVINAVDAARGTGDIRSVNVPQAVMRALHDVEPMGANFGITATTAIIDEVERIEADKPFTHTSRELGETDSWKFAGTRTTDTPNGEEDRAIYRLYGEAAATAPPAGRTTFGEQLARSAGAFDDKAAALAAALRA